MRNIWPELIRLENDSQLPNRLQIVDAATGKPLEHVIGISIILKRDRQEVYIAQATTTPVTAAVDQPPDVAAGEFVIDGVVLMGRRYWITGITMQGVLADDTERRPDIPTLRALGG